ncbi:Exostosin family protein [Euphorbia peplus]|nr:Exostosin family protein [Euphorbia peplus]
MEFRFHFNKLWQMESRKWLIVVAAMALTHILFQFLLLPYGTALRSLLPNSHDPFFDKTGFPLFQSSAKYVTFRNPLTLESNDTESDFDTELETLDRGFESEHENLDHIIEFLEDFDVEDDKGDTNDTSSASSKEISNNSVKLGVIPHVSKRFPMKSAKNPKAISESVKSQDLKSANQTLKPSHVNSTGNVVGKDRNLPKKELQHGASVRRIANLGTSNTSSKMDKPGKKTMRCDMPPKSITLIDEMNRILERNRRSSRAPKPRWFSPRDREIMAVRSQIESAPNLKDRDLYAPLFRNASKFRRSYELMERTLKIYIYKDGKKPIFHLPVLKGLYASEGWFMKLMQGSKRFIVKDPRRAHLFYMPFSSRMLEHALYVRNSHNRTNLRQYLKEYSVKIAAKYPYFNRTNGADHFLVACHDWAPYETRHHMEQCIKALCNADVTSGFKIGRDVSLPETYVRSARNPLRDLGGKPASERNILAFYAGSMHGYLRRILLDHWKDKDTSMKIFGPMPPGVASKMNYIQHMKSSKYCICPKGYEVNSPRVVESIFYECVPVIISDNFVPPFFEVLNWEAFSVILAEKDIPNLKKILQSIPDEKYLQLQLGVRKAQRHFLWHTNPVKYDLFSMTLHSIWYNRVHQIKPR